ncbi:MAG: hypothetical protein QOE26_177 [Verrucomicrobiota bacterium]|jgi:hypothetical protein
MKTAAHTKGTKVTAAETAVVQKGLRRIARKIAKELFTRSNGSRAARLVMESNSGAISDGGWSERNVADHIERHLLKAGGLR